MYQNCTFCTNILDTLLELSNKLVVDALNELKEFTDDHMQQ